MKRRDFLRGSIVSGGAATVASVGLSLPFKQAFAATAPTSVTKRSVVNTMLLGGADLRFLFVPEPGSAYAEKFWQARKRLYQVTTEDQTNYDTYEKVWSAFYLPTTSNGLTFGIHKNAAWLKTQFDLGNVAIIANVVASENRRHDHSQLIMHTGDVFADQYILDRDGWGGRLVNSIAANANVVAMSHDVSIYCNGPSVANRLAQVIHMRDSRDFALPGPNENATSHRSVLARALKSYYEKKGAQVENEITKGKLADNWPFRRFFQHEDAIRSFGDLFKARLDDVQATQHWLLRRLYQYKNLYRLNNIHFGREVANLYDSLLAADVLGMRSAYLEHGSWDTHNDQRNRIEKNIHDLFDKDAGFDSLTNALDEIMGINEDLVYIFTSDFGRQLAANGAGGTDHGRGTYSIIVGRNVRGGTYGEMFPQREIQADVDGKTEFDKLGADIKGMTSFEHVLGAVCDWVQPGSAVKVFPNLANTGITQIANRPILEPGVDLGTLFKPGHGIIGRITNSLGFNDYDNTTISVAGANGVVKTAGLNDKHIYWINELSDNSYKVTPSKPYFNFDPVEQMVQVAGSDVDGVNFTAIPQLHFIRTAKSIAEFTRADGLQYHLFRAIGYNFVSNATIVTIGGQTIELAVRGWFIFMYVPVTISAGEIIVATPTESYVHYEKYEDIIAV